MYSMAFRERRARDERKIQPPTGAMRKTGFDNEKYLREQKEAILERVRTFDNKLYLEFGGKLLYDYHAARVLPGFDPNVKMRLLRELSDRADIILCIYAGDIERKKVRADFGITYDADALKLIDDLKDRGIDICAVVITPTRTSPRRPYSRRNWSDRTCGCTPTASRAATRPTWTCG